MTPKYADGTDNFFSCFHWYALKAVAQHYYPVCGHKKKTATDLSKSMAVAAAVLK